MGGLSLSQGRGAMGEQVLPRESRLDDHPKVILVAVLQLARGAVGSEGQGSGSLGEVHQEAGTDGWLADANLNLSLLVRELGNEVDDALSIRVLQLPAADLTVVYCLGAVGDGLVHMAQEGGAAGGEGQPRWQDSWLQDQVHTGHSLLFCCPGILAQFVLFGSSGKIEQAFVEVETLITRLLGRKVAESQKTERRV